MPFMTSQGGDFRPSVAPCIDFCLSKASTAGFSVKKKKIPFFHVRHNFGKFCSIRSAGSSLAASLKPQSAAELLLLLPSAVTSSINTSDPVPLAATPALRLTDDPSVSRGARTADV